MTPEPEANQTTLSRVGACLLLTFATLTIVPQPAAALLCNPELQETCDQVEACALHGETGACFEPLCDFEIDNPQACVDEVCSGIGCPELQLCTLPALGFSPDCHTVVPCSNLLQGNIGIVVDGENFCVSVSLCQFPQLGLEPECLNWGVCDPPNSVGVTVDDLGGCVPMPVVCDLPGIGLAPDCHYVGWCPAPTQGITVDGDPITCLTVPEDYDADGASNNGELAAGSNPLDADSRPLTDDDGDGTLNSAEPTVWTAEGRASCTGSYGVVLDRTCLGYTTPTGATTNTAFVSGNAVWVWDALCTPGSQGNYPPCKGAGSNYAANAALYTGTFSADGYGWRHVANVPTLSPQNVPVVLPCQTNFQRDQDGDGVPVFRFCNAILTVTPSGSTSTSETGFFIQVGDPNDAQATTPRIVEGPHTLVERSTGDGVHYKLGAKVQANGVTYDLVWEDTVDADALPISLPVPTTSWAWGPDADGDGLPAYVDVGMQTATINDDEDLSLTWSAAPPARYPVDNDDADPIAAGPGPVTHTVPTGFAFGPDADGDGLPATLIVQFSQVTVDGGVTVTPDPGASQSYPIDPDDADPSDPLDVCPSGLTSPPGANQVIVLCGVPIPGPVGILPQCFDGVDNDGDGRTDWAPLVLGTGDAQCTNAFDNAET